MFGLPVTSAGPGTMVADQDARQVWVEDAGLVLCTPFLPQLFTRMGILTATNPTEIAPESRHRAVAVVGSLARESGSSMAPGMPSLLCGLDLDTAEQCPITLASGDIELAESLLRAVIGNWVAMSNASIVALRETFLQRLGRVERDEDRWTVHVERKALDVLVDQIPWTFGTIFHRWMKAPIRVIW